MKQQVLRLIIKSAILLVVLLVADRLIGTWLEHLFYKQTHGDDYTTLYALNDTKDEVLIFGTSRASHHYNASIINEMTGLSCFNAGRDEMEIPYTNAVLGVATKRYTPKVVILDIGPMELGGDKQLLFERIGTVLTPFVTKYPDLASTIGKAGKMELFKIKASKIYRYNSKLGSAIQNAYTNLGHHSVMGYEPLYKTIDTAVYKKSIWDDLEDDKKLNDEYLAILDKIIADTKQQGIQLVMIISPFYFPTDFSNNSSYNTIKQYAAQHPEITFLDFTNDLQFTGQPMLFNDDVHLNDSGAAIYTRKVVQLLAEQNMWK